MFQVDLVREDKTEVWAADSITVRDGTLHILFGEILDRVSLDDVIRVEKKYPGDKGYIL